MDTIVSSGAAGRDSEDALKVLGRVADAFDNPGSLHKMDKEVLFVVNVVKSRHLLTVRPCSFSLAMTCERSCPCFSRAFRARGACVRM